MADKASLCEFIDSDLSGFRLNRKNKRYALWIAFCAMFELEKFKEDKIFAKPPPKKWIISRTILLN